MSVPARAISPEALEEARRLYESTRVPVQQVADLLGIAKSTLNGRVRRWGWKRRIARIPLDPVPRRSPQPAAPVADPPPMAALPGAGADALPRRELIARLVQRIEVEIAAVERLVEKDGREREADGVAETERAARTLAILVRSLRELAALEKNEPESDDDAARDADAFRRELGETLERVLAAGAAC